MKPLFTTEEQTSKLTKAQVVHMLKNKFNPKACLLEEEGNIIECPCCGHMVTLGEDHPNFDTDELPVPLEDLIKQSQEYVDNHG